MKAIFKVMNECVRSYNRSTKGYEFIATVEDKEHMSDHISNLEDHNFFPTREGFVNDANGNEILDPDYPTLYQFGDYTYILVETGELDHYEDAHIIRALGQSICC